MSAEPSNDRRQQSGKKKPPALMLITDGSAQGRIVEQTRRALSNAVHDESLLPLDRIAVQLRDKSSPARELVRLGKALRELTRTVGCLLLVNGRADVALAIEADGLHLPESGVAATKIRPHFEQPLLIGRSCHDPHGLARAAAEGVDYVTLGPLHAVPGKGRPLDEDALETWASQLRLPWLALGGIGPEHVETALRYGASGVATIRSIYAATDPASVLERFRARLGRDR